nr:2-oxoacid:acceptor oxidoreductase family protein [Candidatus Sigynarchaeota archaeon]
MEPTNSQISIAFHGRGGQGAVTAANILVMAAYETKQFPHVMAFPLFGPERRGAPVSAYARISKQEIFDRAKIYDPDIVVIMDPSIFKSLNPAETMKKGGILLVNWHADLNALKKICKFPDGITIGLVDIMKICFDINLMKGRNDPVVNTPVLGAVAKVFSKIPLDVMVKIIKDQFPDPAKAGLNVQGARLAYDSIKVFT